MSTVLADFNALPDRIKDSAGRVRDLTTQLAHERKTRDALIVAAVDEAGIPQAQVARHAGISQPHVIRILAGASD